MAKSRLPLVSDPDAKKILVGLCREHALSMELLTQMIEIQRENLGKGRQIGITQDFSAAIAEFLEGQD